MTGDDDVYRQLQRHLDRMPVPFPATESGVEIRILKQLFTPEEAQLALALSALPEPVSKIHRRTADHLTLPELRHTLNRMADKGSIQKLPAKDGPLYSKAPLVIGMYENQVNRLTPELERDMRAYLDEGFGRALFSMPTPQTRIVPVDRALDAQRTVATYDAIRKYVEASPGPFAAMNCICRQGHDLTGEPCHQTKERQNCLTFGWAATGTIAKRGARALTKDEMLALLDQADRDGLVLEAQNTLEPLFVCCCCGCCCGVLTTVKKFPRPADGFQTDFIAEVDCDKCEICGMCATRCAMDAITSADEPASVAEERCIGCGLCVTTCPSGAVRLREKEHKKTPPKHVRELYTKMFEDRFGRMATFAAAAAHVIGRKV